MNDNTHILFSRNCTT